MGYVGVMLFYCFYFDNVGSLDPRTHVYPSMLIYPRLVLQNMLRIGSSDCCFACLIGFGKCFWLFVFLDILACLLRFFFFFVADPYYCEFVRDHEFLLYLGLMSEFRTPSFCPYELCMTGCRCGS